MRFLGDAGISPKTIAFLRGLDHDAVHVRTLGLERADDSRVVHAAADWRVVLTFDLDSPFDLFAKGNETGIWLGVWDDFRNWLVTAA